MVYYFAGTIYSINKIQTCFLLYIFMKSSYFADLF